MGIPDWFRGHVGQVTATWCGTRLRWGIRYPVKRPEEFDRLDTDAAEAVRLLNDLVLGNICTVLVQAELSDLIVILITYSTPGGPIDDTLVLTMKRPTLILVLLFLTGI